jgi:hypothetical protein
MARIINGINGGFTGKVGTVTGYIRNGGSFMRSRTRRKDTVKSEKRLLQQQKIKVCNEFTKPFSGSGFFNASFPANGATSTGYNRATSAIMNRAIVKEPEVSLQYPLILISMGMLPGAVYASALANDDGDVVFSWVDNTGIGTAKENDRALLVAYFPESKEAVYTISDAIRKDGNAVLQMDLKKGAAETWIGFVSADETLAADSVYTGKIIL